MGKKRAHLALGLAGLLLVLGACGSENGGDDEADHTAPEVVLSFPPNDTTVAHAVTIFAEATDNIAVSHIEFYIDSQKEHTDSTMPYWYEWDCSEVADSTSHSIFAMAYDASGNAGTTDTITVLVRSGDNTPPATVLNLDVVDSTGSSVTLHWTAPGDDGAVGRASYYDIRYIRTDIDPLSWEGATQVSGEPAPATAGTIETLTINGLTWGTTYTFALRAADEAGNWSDISNPTNGTTFEEITTEKVIDCTPEAGGDHTRRGFYLTEVPVGQLAKVTLYISGNAAGMYTFLLTAREDTYDGALIGISQVVVELGDSTNDNRETSFLFPLPVINADSVVTFAIQLVSAPTVDAGAYYAKTTCGGPCQDACPIIETGGTTPPLDTFRGYGMGAKVYVVPQL